MNTSHLLWVVPLSIITGVKGNSESLYRTDTTNDKITIVVADGRASTNSEGLPIKLIKIKYLS